jgi:hypothetical protein
MRRTLLIAGCALLCSAAAASAQTRPELLRVVLDGGAEIATGSFNQSFTIQKNAEDAPFTSNLKMGISPFVNVGVRIRTSPHESIGFVGFFSSGQAAGTMDAKIPNPFYFNQPRDVSGAVSNLPRREMGVHLEFAHAFATSRTTDLTIFGGPSFIAVQQDLVSDVAYTDAYPYDAATFQSAIAATSKKSGVGVNVGGDLTWRVRRSIGLSAQVRYTYASLAMPQAGGDALKLHPVGLQASVGLRFIVQKRPPKRRPAAQPPRRR